jgi:transmembrane 9 superfamily member 2/4
MLLYFGAMSVLTSIVFLISGTIGFIMTYFFLRKIYSMIKID